MGGMGIASPPMLKAASLCWRSAICIGGRIPEWRRLARAVVSGKLTKGVVTLELFTLVVDTPPLKAPELEPVITNCCWGVLGKHTA